MSDSPRVLITGVGLVTPLGADRESSWQRLLAGERALTPLSLGEHPWWPADTAGAFVPKPHHAWDLTLARGDRELTWLVSERAICHAASAALEAAEHADLDFGAIDLTRAACVIGTSKGGMHSSLMTLAVPRAKLDLPRLVGTFESTLAQITDEFESDQREFPEASWLRMAPDGPAVVVASLFNLQGGVLAPVTACATGLSSILRGADLIRSGECDVVLAGSSDASLTPAVLASFRKLGVLASRKLCPEEAVKPYDRNRTGFLIGEGAGIVVLESEAHAKARGAKPLAEWLAGGMASEAAGLTQLKEEPESLTWLIRDVLRRGGVAPGEIDYVSLHGTATKANDLAEVRAIKAAFGPSAYRISASSLKGAIGHLLGAAGSVEFAAMLLAMRDGKLPPTMNLTDPDEECDLDFVAGKSKERTVTHAIKLSLGFGGHLVAGVVRAVQE